MADISTRFFATCGSVTGREHARLGRNNQDGVALAARDGLLVAVVTDGCSSGKWSEVGARLAARWLAEWTPHYLARATGAGRESDLRDLTTGLLRYLVVTGSRLSANEKSWMATLQDYFLFTFLVAVVTPAETLVFGIGDGVFSVNGRITIVDPGPDNAPPYVAYNLATRALPAILRVAPIVHCSAPDRAGASSVPRHWQLQACPCGRPSGPTQGRLEQSSGDSHSSPCLGPPRQKPSQALCRGSLLSEPQ